MLLYLSSLVSFDFDILVLPCFSTIRISLWYFSEFPYLIYNTLLLFYHWNPPTLFRCYSLLLASLYCTSISLFIIETRHSWRIVSSYWAQHRWNLNSRLLMKSSLWPSIPRLFFESGRHGERRERSANGNVHSMRVSQPSLLSNLERERTDRIDGHLSRIILWIPVRSRNRDYAATAEESGNAVENRVRGSRSTIVDQVCFASMFRPYMDPQP